MPFPTQVYGPGSRRINSPQRREMQSAPRVGTGLTSADLPCTMCDMFPAGWYATPSTKQAPTLGRCHSETETHH